jgi:hypothetical protein
VIACDEFFAEFGDYLENRATPLPVPPLPWALRFHRQDGEDLIELSQGQRVKRDAVRDARW